MEFELMIPFGVVIIIFATIICRKYIFIKKSDEDIITCDEGEDNFKINKNYSEDIARINIVDYKENNSEDTMEDLVRERDYDDYSRSMEESIIKTSARYYEEKKEKEETSARIRVTTDGKHIIQTGSIIVTPDGKHETVVSDCGGVIITASGEHILAP